MRMASFWRKPSRFPVSARALVVLISIACSSPATILALSGCGALGSFRDASGFAGASLCAALESAKHDTNAISKRAGKRFLARNMRHDCSKIGVSQSRITLNRKHLDGRFARGRLENEDQGRGGVLSGRGGIESLPRAVELNCRSPGGA